MASLDDLLSQIPIDQLATRLGVDDHTAAQAAKAAVPVLVGGMEANAQHPDGAASLAAALSDHDDALLQGGVDLDQVDTEDGAKIVDNVFGTNRDQVINTLGGKGGGLDAGMLAKVLPILAPLVMSYLAKSRGGSGGGGGAGGLSDVLGGMLGGGAGGSGGGLGDILGGLVGGGGGGGLSDALGGLLGGGKR